MAAVEMPFGTQLPPVGLNRSCGSTAPGRPVPSGEVEELGGGYSVDIATNVIRAPQLPVAPRLIPTPPVTPNPYRNGHTDLTPAARCLGALSPQASPAPSPASAASGGASARRRRPPALVLAPKTPSQPGSTDGRPSGQNSSHSKGGSTGGSSGSSAPHLAAAIANAVSAHAISSMAAAGSVGSRTPGSDAGVSFMDLRGFDELRRVCKLGQGAQGTVEKREHIRTGQFLALKIISAANIIESKREAICLELRTFAKCQNEHIVRFYGAFLHDDHIHIALEYMNAGALSDMLELSHVVPETILANVVWQVLDGLEYLHTEMKVIHRDVKPSNLLLSAGGVVKITDFGVSGELELAQSSKSTMVGAIYYMSPERIVGKKYKYDSDLWSLGLTMIECLTGLYAYIEQDKKCKKDISFWDLMKRIVECDPPRLPEDGFSASCCAFAETVLQKEPKQRPCAAALKSHAWVEDAPAIDRQAQVTRWIFDVKETQKSAGPATKSSRLSELGFAASSATPNGTDGVLAPLVTSQRHGYVEAEASIREPAERTPLTLGMKRNSNPFLSPSTPAGEGFADFWSSGRHGNNPFAAARLDAAEEGRPRADSAGAAHGTITPSEDRFRLGPLPRFQAPCPERELSYEQMLRRALGDRLPADALSSSAPGLNETEVRTWIGRLRDIASALSPETFCCGGESVKLPCKVNNALYIGDAACAQDVDRLREIGISAVLNCGAPRTTEYPNDFAHMYITCEDTEAYELLVQHLAGCLAFFESCAQEGRQLLVHCVMGLNRSAAVVVAFLMLKRGLPLREAVHLVWSCRGHSPLLTNSSFRRELIHLAHLTGHLA